MSRDDALRQRRKWLTNKNKYVIVDTETTGLGRADKIIEMAIIDLEGNILLDTLINPNKRIHWGAEQVHGISNEMVEYAPEINQVAPKVRALLHNRVMLAYNAQFDYRMIRQTFDLNVRYECIMKNVMNLYETNRRISLENATADLRNDYQEHRALDDCFLCLRLINSTMEEIEEVS